MFSSDDGLCGIGELAERARVSVKTVRFYSDNGLLPEASRSAAWATAGTVPTRSSGCG